MLVENFENLNPSNTLWTKNYNLWSKVDTEGPRFIEFEKWWGGHVNLNAEEIQWIVDQLFVGNRLATAEIVTAEGERVDLRNIRSPIICFCSKGDNITPPQQALGWIVDLYGSDDDIRACGQTIVYSVHENVGHLGIFVSGGVAKKEHQEFASNVDLIDVLPPGLYEAVMTARSADDANPEAIGGEWIVRFEPRTLDDIRTIVQPSAENERRFAAVRKISEINLGLYRSLVQPFVRASINDQSAEWLKKLNQAELPFEIFSERNPLMQQVAQLAEQVREHRQPAAPDNPLLHWQALVSDGIIQALDGYRDLRDRNLEKIFLAIYDSPVVQSMLGVGPTDEPPRPRPGMDPERVALIEQRIAELKAGVAEGGAREAAIRALVYIGMAGPGADERAFNTLRQIRAENEGLTLEAFKQILRAQYFSLVLDQAGALAAIPKMLPGRQRRARRACWRASGGRSVRPVRSPECGPSGWRRSSASSLPRPRRRARPRAASAQGHAGAAPDAPNRRQRGALSERGPCRHRSRIPSCKAPRRWSSASPTTARSPMAAPRRSASSAPTWPSPTSTRRPGRTSSRWRASCRRRCSCRSTSASTASSRRCSRRSTSNGARSTSWCTRSPSRPRKTCRAGC